MLYGCYGSNLNKRQMSLRCKDAKPLGFVYLNDYGMLFNRVATIVPVKGAIVPIGLWQISKSDEKNLDRYEGYPHLYRKEIIPIKVNGVNRKVMLYIMNDTGNFDSPTLMYYNTIERGYKDFKIDNHYLQDSLKRTIVLQNRCNDLLRDLILFGDYDEQNNLEVSKNDLCESW